MAADLHFPINLCGPSGLFPYRCEQRSEINRAHFFRRLRSSGRTRESEREKRNLDYRREIVNYLLYKQFQKWNWRCRFSENALILTFPPRGEGTNLAPSLPPGRDGHASASASEGTGMVHLGRGGVRVPDFYNHF